KTTSGSGVSRSRTPQGMPDRGGASDASSFAGSYWRIRSSVSGRLPARWPQRERRRMTAQPHGRTHDADRRRQGSGYDRRPQSWRPTISMMIAGYCSISDIRAANAKSTALVLLPDLFCDERDSIADDIPGGRACAHYRCQPAAGNGIVVDDAQPNRSAPNRCRRPRLCSRGVRQLGFALAMDAESLRLYVVRHPCDRISNCYKCAYKKNRLI